MPDRVQAAAESTLDAPISCPMADGLYIDAEGNVRCYCSTGVAKVLGTIRGRDIMDFFHGETMLALRASLADRVFPYAECRSCGKKRFNAKSVPVPRPTVMHIIHFEPSAACNLECPACPGTAWRAGGWAGGPPPKRRFFPLGEFRDMVDALTVPLQVVVMAGLGEPLLNPDVPAMVAYLKSRLASPPKVRIDTNGSLPRVDVPALVASGVNTVRVGLDGVRQESYVQYRVGGRIDLALAFLEQLVEERERQRRDGLQIVWKYILFEHNDGDADVDRAIELATGWGVDLQFEQAWSNSAGSRRDRAALEEKISAAGAYLRSKEPGAAERWRSFKQLKSRLES